MLFPISNEAVQGVDAWRNEIMGLKEIKILSQSAQRQASVAQTNIVIYA
jgi:hypothetical protein